MEIRYKVKGRMLNPKIKIELKRIDRTVKKFKVKKSEGYTQGFAHMYRACGRWEYCHERNEDVPYRTKDDDGYDIVSQIEGDQFATRKFTDRTPDAPGENHALLLRTNQYAEGHKGLVGAGQFPWLWVILALAVIVAGFITYTVVNKDDTPPPPPVTTTTSPPPDYPELPLQGE